MTSLKEENKLIDKRMRYYEKVKHPCLVCGRKMPIPYDKEYVICSWCKNPIFRTKEEFKKHEFKKKMKRMLIL